MRRGDLPYSFIRAINTNSGNPNAIMATPPVAIPAADGGALISLNIVAANTASPVTVAFNGGVVLTIKTNSGNDIAVGGLTAGMVVAGYVAGATFRLLSDQASAAIVAAAEAAASLAEAWAEGTVPGGPGTKSAKEWAAEAAASAGSLQPETETTNAYTPVLADGNDKLKRLVDPPLLR